MRVPNAKDAKTISNCEEQGILIAQTVDSKNKDKRTIDYWWFSLN
jgi:hypothetical protein